MGWIVCLAALVLAFLVSGAAVADDGSRRCSVASLEGNWGLTLSGTLIAAPPPFAGPGAAVGAFTADRTGHFAGQDTTSANGTVFVETFTGTATMNPDCTGSATVIGNVLGETHFDFVLVDKRTEMLLIRKDPGTVIFGSAKRQQD